jgi:hypothetical protein
MTPTQVTPGKSNPAAPDGLALTPRVVGAADVNDVMREQLEYLIEHAQGGPCGCPRCQRYQQARSLLLEVFA